VIPRFEPHGLAGRFITLEGGEGVGKSTQANRLAEALRERGHHVVVTREPGGSEGAEAIRSMVLEGEANRWSPGCEAMLFAAARGDHVDKLIRPALSRGSWVVCDRFIDSTLAYQGGADHISIDTLMMMHGIATAGMMPDRTFVLTLPLDQAIQRAEYRDLGKHDRFGARSPAYHAAVADAFLGIARRFPDRIRVIDASGFADGVTHRMLNGLEEFL